MISDRPRTLWSEPLNFLHQQVESGPCEGNGRDETKLVQRETDHRCVEVGGSWDGDDGWRLGLISFFGFVSGMSGFAIQRPKQDRRLSAHLQTVSVWLVAFSEDRVGQRLRCRTSLRFAARWRDCQCLCRHWSFQRGILRWWRRFIIWSAKKAMAWISR